MKAGDYVCAKVALNGTAQGRSSAHGDGGPCEIPRRGLCEVFDVERITGWLTLHHDLDESGSLEPYRCEAIAFPDQVEPATRPPLPPTIPQGPPNIE